MKGSYLEITYRRGRPIAAYLYLPRGSRDKSQRTAKAPGGLVIDYTRGGKAIGIEITTPSKATLSAVNRVLRALDFPPITQADLAPLRAA